MAIHGTTDDVPVAPPDSPPWLDIRPPSDMGTTDEVPVAPTAIQGTVDDVPRVPTDSLSRLNARPPPFCNAKLVPDDAVSTAGAGSRRPYTD